MTITDKAKITRAIQQKYLSPLGETLENGYPELSEQLKKGILPYTDEQRDFMINILALCEGELNTIDYKLEYYRICKLLDAMNEEISKKIS